MAARYQQTSFEALHRPTYHSLIEVLGQLAAVNPQPLSMGDRLVSQELLSEEEHRPIGTKSVFRSETWDAAAISEETEFALYDEAGQRLVTEATAAFRNLSDKPDVKAVGHIAFLKEVRDGTQAAASIDGLLLVYSDARVLLIGECQLPKGIEDNSRHALYRYAANLGLEHLMNLSLSEELRDIKTYADDSMGRGIVRNLEQFLEHAERPS